MGDRGHWDCLVLLGIWLLSGHDVLLRLPHVRGAAPTGGAASMLLYGIAYAVASLSCTVAPFLAVTTSTFRAEGVLDGLAVYVAYALGMGLVVGVISLAVALAQEGVVQQVRDSSLTSVASAECCCWSRARTSRTTACTRSVCRAALQQATR